MNLLVSLAAPHAWLRTGPDTMPEDKRTRLQLLRAYWSYVRMGACTCTRDEWLLMSMQRQFDVYARAIAMTFTNAMVEQMNGRSSLQQMLFPTEKDMNGWAARSLK